MAGLLQVGTAVLEQRVAAVAGLSTAVEREGRAIERMEPTVKALSGFC